MRDAILRILAETHALAPDLALAMAFNARKDALRAHGASPTPTVAGDQPLPIIGHNHNADPFISACVRAIHASRNIMENYTAADRLRGALTHPGTTIPFVEVGQEVWIHRLRHSWLRGAVHSLDGKTVYVRRNGQLFSSHGSRAIPYISRSPPTAPAASSPPAASASAPAPPAPALIRTHSPTPLLPALLPLRASVFLSRPANPDSASHPCWDAAKATESAVFANIDCKRPLPSHLVPRHNEIFHYLWRVTYKPNRGKGKPAERAHFCIAGNHDRHKHSTVATSPVSPEGAIRAVVAASVIL